MCFDHNQRKMILGATDGSIAVFNAMSGSRMKPLEAHSKEVIDLKYIAEYKAVASLGHDRVLKIHDEAPISRCPVRQRVNLYRKGLKVSKCLMCHDGDTWLCDREVMTMVLLVMAMAMAMG